MKFEYYNKRAEANKSRVHALIRLLLSAMHLEDALDARHR